MNHVVGKCNPSTPLREHYHDQIRRKRRNKEMDNVLLKTEIGLDQTNNKAIEILDVVIFRRWEFAMNQSEGIAAQETDNKSKLLGTKTCGHPRRVYRRQNGRHHHLASFRQKCPQPKYSKEWWKKCRFKKKTRRWHFLGSSWRIFKVNLSW